MRQKWEWGCESDAKGPPLMLDGEALKRCPRRPLLDDPQGYSHLIWLYRQYQGRNTLPEPGGLMDQSAVLLECFQIMERTLDFTDGVKAEKERARQARHIKMRGRKP